jgi:hypothetical protein
VSEFFHEVEQAFQDLIAKSALVLESSRYEPESFGNAMVVLAGRNIRIRLVRDRGQAFAQAASNLHPEDWSPLQRVLEAVGVSSARPEGLLTPAQAAQMVEQHFDALDVGLGCSEIRKTRAKLAQLERIAADRFLERLRQGPH